MRNNFVASLFIIALFGFSLDTSERGYYNLSTGSLVCHEDEQCLHEIGHVVDKHLAWISRSEKYRDTLTAYLLMTWKFPEYRDEMSEKILLYPGFFTPLLKDNNPTYLSFWVGGWGGTMELYADMLKWSNGNPENMPSGFLKFYDWEMVAKLMEKYEVSDAED